MPATTKTPAYIKGLLQPTTRAPAGRKVWSIDLERVWLPFFTATNVQGETQIPHEALGAPLRLAKAKDGTVRFNAKGAPVQRVAAEIRDAVSLVKDNFEASLVAYAGGVAKANPEGYKAQVEAAQTAATPINAQAQADIEAAIKAAQEAQARIEAAEKLLAQAQAVADATPAEAPAGTPAEAPIAAPVAAAA